jgi:hypothetical protein
MLSKRLLYRKGRKGFAKNAKLILYNLSLCDPCDFFFATLTVIISDLWDTLFINSDRIIFRSGF